MGGNACLVAEAHSHHAVLPGSVVGGRVDVELGVLWCLPPAGVGAFGGLIQEPSAYSPAQTPTD